MIRGARRAARRASQAASVLERAEIYCDVSPLLEEQWTGIPVVAAGLAGALLRRMPEQARFFLGTDILATDLVADAVRRNTGLHLQRDIARGRAVMGRLPLLGATVKPNVGIFPSVKPVRRAFDAECNVFHDLSTLVLPHFHIKGNVDHHMEAMMADIASSDIVACVSEASRADLIDYLGVPADKIVVALNGVSWPDWYGPGAANDLAPLGAEPYLLILGTREPRKNVMLVFDMLEQAPELLETHRIVFVGKMGWLEEQHALPRALEPALAGGRILFTGFVSDYRKYVLLAGAEATIYPSLFEGFGLPVLESLSAGTPCVASWSSSIPEIGGDLCCYFDPLSADDLHRAVAVMLERRRHEGQALDAACRDRAALFTWERALSCILDPLGAILASRGA